MELKFILFFIILFIFVILQIVIWWSTVSGPTYDKEKKEWIVRIFGGDEIRFKDKDKAVKEYNKNVQDQERSTKRREELELKYYF